MNCITKKRLLAVFIVLLSLVGVLFAGQNILSGTYFAKADTTYKLTFYEDTSFSNTIKEISGAGDTVITKAMMDFGVPEKENKVFSGWSQTPPNNSVGSDFFVNKTLNGLYTEYFDASSVAPTEMTYFVVYSTAYTLIFYDTDNTTVLKTLTGAADTVITEEMLNFQVTPKSGYEFKGWYTFADAGMYQPLVGLTMGFAATMSEPDATSSSFYPQFEQETTYTLTFKDGDTVLKTYTCKQGFHLLLGTVSSDWSKSGYKILGISETPDGEITAIAFDTAITVTADKTYYVHYQKTRKISIYVSGIVEPRIVNVPEKTDVKLKDYVSVHMVEKDGYTLVGFSLKENGVKMYDYNDSVLNLSSDITLYALYTIDADTLYFEEYSSYKWKDTISFTGLSKNITLNAGINDLLMGSDKTLSVTGLDTVEQIIINPTERKILCKGQNSSFEDMTVTLYDGTSWTDDSYQIMWFPRPIDDSNYTMPITDSASLAWFKNNVTKNQYYFQLKVYQPDDEIDTISNIKPYTTITEDFLKSNSITAEQEKNGKIFKGWFDETGISVMGCYIQDIQNQTIKANYSATLYEIKFYDTDNTTILKTLTGSADTVITEEMLNFQVTPKSGYEFKGWYTFADAGIWNQLVGMTLQGAATMSESNVTESSFYPQFEKITAYTVTFYDSDNTTILKTITSSDPDLIITLEMLNFEVTLKDGYKFNGWFPSIDNAGVGFFVTDMKISVAVTMQSTDATSISLYPQFQQYFTITIKDGNETIKQYNYAPSYVISSITLRADLYKAGFYILGFSETVDGEISPVSDITVSADKIYYIRYQKVWILTIKYGTAEIAAAEVPSDTQFRIRDYISYQALSKDGYNLKGFALTENGEIAYTYDSTPLKLTDDLTLYAVYEKYNAIKVIADGKVKFTATTAKGKSLNLGSAGITSIMEKDGYTLKGYATAENGEIVYEADAVISPESDMTLYAIYEKIKTPDDPDSPGDSEAPDKDSSSEINVSRILSVILSVTLFAAVATGVVIILKKVFKF